MRQSSSSWNLRQPTQERYLCHHPSGPHRSSVATGQPTCEGGRVGCASCYLAGTVCFFSICRRNRSTTATASTSQFDCHDRGYNCALGQECMVLSRQQLMSYRSCCLQAINVGQAGSCIRPTGSDQQSQQYRRPSTAGGDISSQRRLAKRSPALRLWTTSGWSRRTNRRGSSTGCQHLRTAPMP